MEISEIIKEIENNFWNGEYIRDNELTECSCDECVWAIKRFIGKKWETMKIEDLSTDQCDANISLLSPKAFIYFLPGFMKLSLTLSEEEDFISNHLTSAFTRADIENESLKVSIQRIIGLLNSQQKQIVALYLEILSKRKTEIPIIIFSAINNLISNKITFYSQTAVNRWLEDNYNFKQD